MSPGLAIELVTRAVMMVLMVGAPILITALVVGVLVSFVQALTQINEQTLTFVPKILAVFGALVVTGPWLMQSLVGYTTGLFTMLPAMAR